MNRKLILVLALGGLLAVPFLTSFDTANAQESRPLAQPNMYTMRVGRQVYATVNVSIFAGAPGAVPRIDGKLVAMNSEWVVIDRGQVNGEIWIPRTAVLHLRVQPAQ